MMTIQSKKIYSAGTSTRSENEFLELLDAFSIKIVADVRRFPKSKLEHFSREAFRSFLDKEGIEYLYLGEELGGFRKGGYETYVLTEAFIIGLNGLEEAGLKGYTIFVCAERLPWQCHRRFIGDALKERGWDVIHVIDKGHFW